MSNAEVYRIEDLRRGVKRCMNKTRRVAASKYQEALLDDPDRIVEMLLASYDLYYTGKIWISREKGAERWEVLRSDYQVFRLIRWTLGDGAYSQEIGEEVLHLLKLERYQDPNDKQLESWRKQNAEDKLKRSGE